jgi:hypothetical protein
MGSLNFSRVFMTLARCSKLSHRTSSAESQAESGFAWLCNRMVGRFLRFWENCSLLKGWGLETHGSESLVPKS